MVKKLKNTPFWNVLRRGSAATLALIVVAMSCFVPISAADEPTEPTEPVYSEGLTYTFSGSNATVTGPGTWTGGELRIPPQVTVDGVTYSVTAIGADAFIDNTDVVSLVMPVTVVSLGQRAFQGCVNLTSVSGGSNIASSNYCFDNCVTLRNFDFSGFKTITASYFLRGTQVKTVVIPSTCSQFSPSSLGDFEYLFYSSGSVITAPLPSSCQELHFDGTLKEYVQSFSVNSSARFFQDQTHFFLSGVEVTGTLRLPDSVTITTCFSGLTSIETLIVPSTVSFSWHVSGSSAYVCYFSYCKNLKNVYWNNSASNAIESSAKYKYLFRGCVSLEKFYYNGALTSLSFNGSFLDTNSTFTLYLPGASDDYTLTGFSNPIVYDSVFVTPDFQYLYTDSNVITNNGGSIFVTLQPLKNYGLPGTVDVTDTSGTSLGWTNGVEYTYNSTTGQFTVPALIQNIQLRAIGVSLVPNYYFFNADPAFQSFIGNRITFEATDFNGLTVTGAFIRLEDERLCFYQIVADEHVLVWADDTGWASPLYRYLDFGSYEIGEDLAYFLRATASVPSIGSMLLQIYNASGGGSSGGSYDAGYSDGYDVGFEDGRDVGYGEGYDVGFEDGSATSGGGGSPGTTGTIFDYCTFYVTFDVRDDSGRVTTTSRRQIEPDMGVGTVSPTGAIALAHALTNLPGQTVVGCTLYMVWGDAHFFDYSTFPIFVSGEEAPSLTAQMYNVEDQSFALVPSYRESDGLYVLAPMYVDTYPQSKNCTEIRMDVATPMVWGVTISTNAEMYSVGYGNGYGDGYDKGANISTQDAFNEGHREGYIVGKQEGIKISERGNFYNLFVSLSDAVFGSFLALFSFEILGVNMQTIFGALLTLCVLLIVLFKFTGKKE